MAEKMKNAADYYKFQHMLVYCNPEKLIDGRLNYRYVYDVSEVDYVSVELSFYNKKFDEEEWEVEVMLTAIEANSTAKEKICEIRRTVVVGKDKNIVDFREGWGMETRGSFWKKGTYLWTAFIDGTEVGKTYFHIVDSGLPNDGYNPYFKINSIKLFESPRNIPQREQRNYYTSFSAANTRFIWVELEIENTHENGTWVGEFISNFYTHANKLKGTDAVIQRFEEAEKGSIFYIETGWGSDTKGTWFIDDSRLEIVFLNSIIAVVPFKVEADFVSGTTAFQLPAGAGIAATQSFALPDVMIPPDEIFKEMDSLIGLREIKTRLREYVNYMKFLKLRVDKGIEEKKPINLHAVFTGNPGTGKTRVAKLLGQIYKSLGLLTRDTVKEVDRADLVGEYIGQTAPKVKKAIQEARGGILFIDEAYSLARKDDTAKDFGHEVIEILLKELSDGPGNLAVIVAGYPEEMESFLNSNPGIKSRFTNNYHFDDYLPDELTAIALSEAMRHSLTFHPDAVPFLEDRLREAYRKRDRTFGNARYALWAVTEAKFHLGLRLMKSEKPEELTSDDLSTIQLADMYEVFESSTPPILRLPVEEEMIREVLDELNSYTGLEVIKNDIHEMIKLVRFYKEMKKDVLNSFSLHTVFTGNPGTGKTSIARLMAKLYKGLGLLEKGHLVECDREDLIAGFIGQTALKTDKIIQSAMGGVLFIDEAYSLSNTGGANDFGFEAIEILLKRMEDNRGLFACIVAGYTEEMDQFLKSNPGLNSRFDRTMHFDDYSPAEMLSISQTMLKKEGITAEPEALQILQAYFTAHYQQRDKYFGNARFVRKVVIEAIRNQNLRLADLPMNERKPEMMKQLLFVDVEEFNAQNDPLGSPIKKPLGFN